MSRLFILILALMLIACSEYPNVTHVCVNYLEPDSECGTGFFIDHDKLITAKHIIDKSNSRVLTLVGPGPNETTHTYTYYDDLDVVMAKTSPDIAESYFNVCDQVHEGASVDMVARRSRFGDLEIKSGIITQVNQSQITVDVPTLPGYSGGPIIDLSQQCVVGSIVGIRDASTVGINLVYLLHQPN